MIDFDVDDIREEIKDLLYEDKESELDEIVHELNGYISDISSLKKRYKLRRMTKCAYRFYNR